MLSSRLPFQAPFILASFTAVSLILTSGCQSIHDKKEVTVEILHTNDMHSHFAGSKNGSACDHGKRLQKAVMAELRNT